MAADVFQNVDSNIVFVVMDSVFKAPGVLMSMARLTLLQPVLDGLDGDVRVGQKKRETGVDREQSTTNSRIQSEESWLAHLLPDRSSTTQDLSLRLHPPVALLGFRILRSLLVLETRLMRWSRLSKLGRHCRMLAPTRSLMKTAPCTLERRSWVVHGTSREVGGRCLGSGRT